MSASGIQGCIPLSPDCCNPGMQKVTRSPLELLFCWFWMRRIFIASNVLLSANDHWCCCLATLHAPRVFSRTTQGVEARGESGVKRGQSSNRAVRQLASHNEAGRAEEDIARGGRGKRAKRATSH